MLLPNGKIPQGAPHRLGLVVVPLDSPSSLPAVSHEGMRVHIDLRPYHEFTRPSTDLRMLIMV